MDQLTVQQKSETEEAWRFEVFVGGGSGCMRYEVVVMKLYWRKLTSEKVQPQPLVKASFEFLLAREPKEFIMRSFDLGVISRYFPEYEQEMRKRFHISPHA